MIAIGLLIPLVIIGAVIAGIVALAKRNDAEPEDGLARRLVVSALTFGMTVVAAVGVFLLLDVAFAADALRGGSRTSDVAQALALLIVGVPSATLLWRYLLRSLAGEDGHSVIWLIHLALASATFSIGSVVALGNGLRFHEFGTDTRSSLAFAIPWVAVWAFHEWVRGRRPAPVIPGLPPAIGSGVGLVTTAAGGVGLIAASVDLLTSTRALATTGAVDPIISAAIWTIVGLAAWWWQSSVREEPDPAATTVTIGLGVGGGTLLGLGGLAGLIFLALDATTDVFDTDALGVALGAAAVGFLVWRYHAPRVSGPQQERIARHVIAGIGLIALASSVGVLVNTGLSALATPFARRDPTELLWGGLAVLVVAAPTWWLTWRPETQPDDDTATAVRRTYLTLLAGVGGVTGAIALIVLFFQLLEGLLDGVSFGSIVDGVRAPLGFVIATGLVTFYHYRLWRAGRPEEETEPITLQRITLVGPAETADRLRDQLGVRVTAWRSPGEGRVLSEEELGDHLRTLDARDALVVAEERGYRVIRLLQDGQRPQTGEPQE